MRFRATRPPRVFGVGADGSIKLKECAKIELAPDELVTFVAGGTQYDVTRKDFGYYATTSLNRRLGRFGLKPALVESYDGTYYILLVMKTKEKEFRRYLKGTRQRLVIWMHRPNGLERLEPGAGPKGRLTCICGSKSFKKLFHYSRPPKGETRFAFANASYQRDIFRCRACGHCVSACSMDLGGMYGREYVDSTYGSRMLETFKRIMALPRGRSDNAGRVEAVCAFARRHFGKAGRRALLDVGSGLAVFPAAMKARGWSCTALDPDPRAALHARRAAGVKAVAADFRTAKGLGLFDAISLNKVVEHVPDPVSFLGGAAAFLKKGGFVYVEVPDAEAAAAEGRGREEFFIEHLHVFSAASLAVLASRAGFALKELERLREPSSKFTLRGYMTWA